MRRHRLSLWKKGHPNRCINISQKMIQSFISIISVLKFIHKWYVYLVLCVGVSVIYVKFFSDRSHIFSPESRFPYNAKFRSIVIAYWRITGGCWLAENRRTLIGSLDSPLYRQKNIPGTFRNPTPSLKAAGGRFRPFSIKTRKFSSFFSRQFLFPTLI